MPTTEEPKQFTAIFGIDSSCEYRKEHDLNVMFLRCTQMYANDKLRLNKHLFLNEVHDMLGLPRTSEGQMVGWVWDINNPDSDKVVDFGIDNNPEGTDIFKLTFNVDGHIWELI